MTMIERGDRESFDGFLRRFKKAVQDDQILTTTRRKRFFEKPSQQRKRKAARKLRKSRQITRKMAERNW
jgi:small subunit ribosomal protein S21